MLINNINKKISHIRPRVAVHSTFRKKGVPIFQHLYYVSYTSYYINSI